MLLRRRKYESRRGFTLVELVVVLVILAILASVAVPAFSRQLETGQERKAVTEAQACVTAATGLGDRPTVGGADITLTGLAIAALCGVILNAILPGNDYEFGVDPQGDKSADLGSY